MAVNLTDRLNFVGDLSAAGHGPSKRKPDPGA